MTNKPGQMWPEQKAIGVSHALQYEYDRYQETGHARHVGRAWQIARAAKVAIPDWVLRHVDGVAHALTRKTPSTKTADRFAFSSGAAGAQIRHVSRLRSHVSFACASPARTHPND